MQPVKTTNDKAIQFWNKCVCALPQKTVGAKKKQLLVPKKKRVQAMQIV